MPKTLQIRDVPDDQYRVLAERAARAGVSVPELLRREIERLTGRPSMDEWLERTDRGGHTHITPAQVIESLDEIRGPWPGDEPG